MNENTFLTQKDLDDLRSYGHDNPEQDIQIFLKELRKYFNTYWGSEYYIEKDFESLEELNKTQLSNYPSWSGYMILDDSFTGPTCPVNILSNKSKKLLGYFYDIWLR